MAKLTVLCLLLAGLSACTPGPRDGLPPGWVKPDPDMALAERHCYRTLGRVDCHTRPVVGEAYRKVGFFDAPLTR